MRRPLRSMRAAATVKKKTEPPIFCMTKRLRWRSMCSNSAPLRELRGGFGVDAIGDERRTDAVAGNVADQQVEMIVVERADQAEIAADGAHRMVVGVDVDAAPDDRSRRQALLHARGQSQILVHFPLAFFEAHVGVAQFRFGAFLVRMSVKVTMAKSRPSGSSSRRELTMTGMRPPSCSGRQIRNGFARFRRSIRPASK